MERFAQWNEKTGGYFGIEDGTYAFQGAEITPYWQLVGVGVTIGFAVVSGLILIWGLDKIIPLRASEEEEISGLDPTYWNVPPAGADIGSGDGGRSAAPAEAARREAAD